MPSLNFSFVLEDKNFKAVVSVDKTTELNLCYGRKSVTLTQDEAVLLYEWLGDRLGVKNNMANTTTVLTTTTKPEVSEDGAASEARRGIIDMSSRLTPKKFIVKS